PAQIIALFLGSRAARLGHDGHDSLEGEQARVFGAQRAIVKANVVDQTGEVSFIMARPDSQRLMVEDGTLEFVLLGLDVARTAIDKDLHAGALAGAVISHENV